jgi:hypothetical protein
MKNKGRVIQLDFQYAGSPQTRGQQGRNRKKREENTDEIEVAERNSVASTYPTLRSRAPAGFGQLTQTTPSSSTENLSARPTVGREPPSTAHFPTPSEIQDKNTLHLTPAQQDVFAPGGPELMSIIQKVLKTETTLKELKLSFWSFINGKIEAETLLREFVANAKRENENKKEATLINEINSIWHRMFGLFAEDPETVQKHEILVKKQKKKGLSIQEFEQMINREPKKYAMMRVWNDLKLKVYISLSSGKTIWKRKTSKSTRTKSVFF